MKKIVLVFALVLSFLISTNSYAEEKGAIQLAITVNSRVIIVSLNDNPTTRDLLSLLPLTLEMRDYVSRLKYVYLPRALSEENGKRQSAYESGDVAYYPKTKEFILFYRNGATLSSDYIIIGKITSDLDAFSALGNSGQMRIELNTAEAQAKTAE